VTDEQDPVPGNRPGSGQDPDPATQTPASPATVQPATPPASPAATPVPVAAGAQHPDASPGPAASTWSPEPVAGGPAGLPPGPPVEGGTTGAPIEPGPQGAGAEPPGQDRRSRPPAWRKVGYLFAVLSIIALPIALLTVWSHYLVLNTDGWVSVVGPAARNEAVIEAVSTRLSEQVVEAVDIGSRLDEVLPGLGTIIARPIEEALQQFIKERTTTVMRSDEFQTIWVEANREVHSRVVAVLRGEAQNIEIENGQVTINLLPLVGLVLQSVQDTLSQILGRPIDIPILDLPPDQLIPALESALGIDLPDDLGLITVDAPAIQTASNAVRLFDALAIILPILFLAFTAAALLLATRRWRMLFILLAGWAVGGLLLLIVAGLVRSAVVSAFAAADVQAAIGAIMDPALRLARVGATLLVVGGIAGCVVLFLTGDTGAARSIRARAERTLRGSTEGAAGG
jgi:hypothetical protein